MEIGHIELGRHGQVEVASGFLNIGEASGIPIIESLLEIAERSAAAHVIIDCPPGSACSVVESVKEADLCLIVAERRASAPTILRWWWSWCRCWASAAR